MACTQTSVHALAQRDAIHSFTLSFLQPPPGYRKKRDGMLAGTVESEMTALSLSPLSASLSHSRQSALPQHQSRGRRLGLKWITPTESVCPHWTQLRSRLSGHMFKNSLSVSHKQRACTHMHILVPMFPNGHWRAASVTFPCQMVTVFCVCAMHTQGNTWTHTNI